MDAGVLKQKVGLTGNVCQDVLGEVKDLWTPDGSRMSLLQELHRIVNTFQKGQDKLSEEHGGDEGVFSMTT
ncbi:hypothetical protein GCM10022631_13590 [Deinococcus rubellus]